MRKFVLIAVLCLIAELSHGAPRTAPKLGGRTPQYMRKRGEISGRIVGGEFGSDEI